MLRTRSYDTFELEWNARKEDQTDEPCRLRFDDERGLRWRTRTFRARTEAVKSAR